MWSTNACPVFTRVQSKGRFARHPQLNQARADTMQSRTYCSTCRVPFISSYIRTMHTILYTPLTFILFEVHILSPKALRKSPAQKILEEVGKGMTEPQQWKTQRRGGWGAQGAYSPTFTKKLALWLYSIDSKLP